jgi:hypothetical protein
VHETTTNSRCTSPGAQEAQHTAACNPGVVAADTLGNPPASSSPSSLCLSPLPPSSVPSEVRTGFRYGSHIEFFWQKSPVELITTWQLAGPPGGSKYIFWRFCNTSVCTGTLHCVLLARTQGHFLPQRRSVFRKQGGRGAPEVTKNTVSRMIRLMRTRCSVCCRGIVAKRIFFIMILFSRVIWGKGSAICPAPSPLLVLRSIFHVC